MKKIFKATLFFIIATILLSFQPQQIPQPFALIELFTSQGCSSCPPAEKLISRTLEKANQAGMKLYVLTFHVDYWNRLGWTDPFSDKKYSDRQYEYSSSIKNSSVYTPQVIVNGTEEFVGSNETKLTNALTNAFKDRPEVQFETLSIHYESGKRPIVRYKIQGNIMGSTINLAIVSNKETTFVKHGENGGRTLTSENVVRQFYTFSANAFGSVELADTSLPVKNNLSILAFVQRKADNKILGAALTE